MKCPSCGKTFDLWTHVVDLLKEKTKLFRNRGAAFIGARETWFTFQLPPNETKQINLADFDVPEDSKLIYIIFTPEQGAGWPLEMQSNELLQHKTRHKITFYGKPFPDSKECQPTKHNVNMCVTYIPKTIDQIPFELLSNAYESFLEDNYQEMILPSAVAVEDAIKSLASELLNIIELPNNLEPNRHISLRIILPLVAKLYSIPNLNQKIVNPVLKLWKFRDKMAHKGILEDSLDLGEAARLLAAAMFSINYFSFFSGYNSSKNPTTVI